MFGGGGWSLPSVNVPSVSVKLGNPHEYVSNLTENMELGWKTGYDSGGVLGGVFGLATGTAIGALGQKSEAQKDYRPTYPDAPPGTPPNPNTFGDITQGAPGAWIRAKQGTGTTRTSTFLTRGMSAGKIKARQTASGSTGY